MKRVLLIDDDPIVLRVYQEGLAQEGLHVDTAADGLAGITSLRAAKPDLVVLDLMMPKLTGVDVLKFIRSEAELKDLPVIVLSNSYMNQLATEAAALGVQKALLKVRCSPSVLRRTIREIWEGNSGGEDLSHLLAAPGPGLAAPSPAGASSSDPQGPALALAEERAAAAFQVKARDRLLQDARIRCRALRGLCQEVVTAPNETARDVHLQNLYRKVHFTVATASLAESHRLAQMASAFEAMLFELIGKPALVSASVLRTIASTVDFLALLYDCARNAEQEAPFSAQALVVDDDAINNRLVVAALQLAHLKARSTSDPVLGLQWLEQSQYDLILLDVEMPGMDGFEFCRRLRKLPNYKKTTVIFVTSHDDFESRVGSVLSGGNDLIAKPIFPLELSVKAVSHLLRRQLAL